MGDGKEEIMGLFMKRYPKFLLKQLVSKVCMDVKKSYENNKKKRLKQ